MDGNQSGERRGAWRIEVDKLRPRAKMTKGDDEAPGNVLARSALPTSEAFPVSEDLGPHNFQKLKLLGRGAVGKVYLVLLKGKDKVYAMKVLTKKEMIEKNKIKRVLTEREILATVNHPLIVTMYASFQTAERLYYVMDYCQGGEFYQFLQKQPNQRLPEAAVKFYTAEVVLALEYLHHMGFIYRDLKPENVLMRANGHIALTDFDLSKQGQAISPRVIETQLSLVQKMKSGIRGNSKTDACKSSSSLALANDISFAKNLTGKKGGNRTSLEIVDSEPVLTGDCTSFVGTEEYIAPEVRGNFLKQNLLCGAFLKSCAHHSTALVDCGWHRPDRGGRLVDRWGAHLRNAIRTHSIQRRDAGRNLPKHPRG